jgi:hypothetical protein
MWYFCSLNRPWLRFEWIFFKAMSNPGKKNDCVLRNNDLGDDFQNWKRSKHYGFFSRKNGIRILFIFIDRTVPQSRPRGLACKFWCLDTQVKRGGRLAPFANAFFVLIAAFFNLEMYLNGCSAPVCTCSCCVHMYLCPDCPIKPDKYLTLATNIV